MRPPVMPWDEVARVHNLIYKALWPSGDGHLKTVFLSPSKPAFQVVPRTATEIMDLSSHPPGVLIRSLSSFRN